METEVKSQTERKIHHGHAIKRLRRDKGLSQQEFGKLVGASQSKVGRDEDEAILNDKDLELYAKGLGVSVDFIKNMEDEKPLVEYIQNNNNTYNVESGNFNNVIKEEGNTIYNGIDSSTLEKILDRLENLCKKNVEQCSEMIKGYIQLVEAYKENPRNAGKKEGE